MHSSERNIYTVFTLKVQLDPHLSLNLQESCEACIEDVLHLLLGPSQA